MADTLRLILASASPRRRMLLDSLGLEFAVHPVNVDESERPGETSEEYVSRIARAKAVASGQPDPGCLVLAADTTVVIDDECLGKPSSTREACAMLERLSGRVHRVYSAVALAGAGRVDTALSISRVEFATLPADWIRAYAAGGEPMDKAGAYAIQGQAAGWIRSLEGSYSGVVGLPLYETADLLRRAGFLV